MKDGDLIHALWGRGEEMKSSFAGAIVRTLRVCSLSDGDRRSYIRDVERDVGRRIGHRVRDVREAVLGAYRSAIEDMGVDAEDAGGGFRQEDVALILDMSPSSYQKLEQGGTGLTAGRLGVLADLYGVPVEVLVSPLEGDALADEAEVLRALRSMTPGQRRTLVDVARGLTESPNPQDSCDRGRRTPS